MEYKVCSTNWWQVELLLKCTYSKTILASTLIAAEFQRRPSNANAILVKSLFVVVMSCQC